MRPQRARRRLGGARVLAIKLRVEPFPTCRRRGLCDECQPRCGATPFEPRPVGTVPERVPPWRHTLSTRTVRPTGACRAPATNAACVCVFEATMARPPLCVTGRSRGGPLVFREEQEFSPSPPASARPGGRQPLGSRAARPMPCINGQRPGQCSWPRRPALRRPPPRRPPPRRPPPPAGPPAPRP